MKTVNDLEAPFDSPINSSDPNDAEQEYLSSLRDTIAANRATCHEALVSKLVDNTIEFLDEYKTTVYPHARLTFEPRMRWMEPVPSNPSDPLKKQGKEEYPSRERFERSRCLQEAIVFEKQPDLAKRLAALLKAALERRLGNFERLEHEKGVVVTVDTKHEQRHRKYTLADNFQICLLVVNVEMRDIE